jgi:ATP-dependent Clp protease adaptor protein ClpS
MSKANFSLDEKEDVFTLESIAEDHLSQLIVYNDDYNTFDWVIQCFMEVCQHTFEQSEQLSLIIHFKGKAVCKTDSMDKLIPLKDALIERGLSAVIEHLKESN